MTANELAKKFGDEYGFNPWPSTFEVDAETYASCCQAVFNNILESKGGPWISLRLGLSGGIMFKNVELLLK